MHIQTILGMTQDIGIALADLLRNYLKKANNQANQQHTHVYKSFKLKWIKDNVKVISFCANEIPDSLWFCIHECIYHCHTCKNHLSVSMSPGFSFRQREFNSPSICMVAYNYLYISSPRPDAFSGLWRHGTRAQTHMQQNTHTHKIKGKKLKSQHEG